MKRLVLGITGGIATGKSTVLAMLAKQGLPTLSADTLAHEAIRRGGPAYRAVVRGFGNSILGSRSEIDRKRLGQIVFANPKARKKLERIIHPCVLKAMRRFVRAHKGTVALDIPLLFEAGYAKWVDKIIVVSASQAQQIARLRQRNGLTRSQALQRINAQIPLMQKCRRADIVLDNGHGVGHLRAQVKKMCSSNNA